MMPKISNWRFCKVRPGDKVPYPGGWQNMPLTLEQIPKGDNYGLLTGPFSGILAIDFDGKWAFEWWEKSGLPNLPDTICWTSGREARVQYAFSVPEELWQFITTTKFNNGLKKPNQEGIEFRWAGAQSVMPPSIHPETQKPYEWVGVETVAECPVEVLEFLVEHHSKPVVSTRASVTPAVSINSPEMAELTKVMHKVHTYYPNPSYDMWRNFTWACITHVGVLPGIATMMVFYPEQKRGEYDTLARNYHTNNSPSIGTLIHAVQLHEPDWNPKKLDTEFIKGVLKKYGLISV